MANLPLQKWLTPNIGVKRWLMLAAIGLFVVAFALALAILKFISEVGLGIPTFIQTWGFITLMVIGGGGFACIGLTLMIRNLLAPYRRTQKRELVDLVVEHTRRKRGFKFVAIGGGTGLPASLRGMKRYTSNITAVVTVADDGGSSGRLRRDMGIAPPGDIRNNIVALADDDSMLTKLFQYRFEDGDLDGHSFGNLFIAALSDLAYQESGNGRNSLAEALIEVERVLNIHGRVLPSTLDDVHLTAELMLDGSQRTIKVKGESQIEQVAGTIKTIAIEPGDAVAYAPSVQAILDADVIVIGPGSLYTSILPNLMVEGIADALRATDAIKIYVCNVATQPVETAGYTVAEHVMALENHIGRGVFQAVLANDHYPERNAGIHTYYVPPAPEYHEILQRYEIRYTDLTDEAHPWRHDTHKLAEAILQVVKSDVSTSSTIIKSAV
jgi:uncharacterized cofD-like protein